jgi:hypothetical protein|tara:strand:- start:651 stop:1094 length:444 start_codon:yes stop_codon:yes gene_type:complete
MKITKRQLRKIIREEKSKILSEARVGNVSVGFQGWSPNKQVDFAKAYGKDAKMVKPRSLDSRQRNSPQIKQEQAGLPEMPSQRESDFAMWTAGAWEEEMANSKTGYHGMAVDAAAGELQQSIIDSGALEMVLTLMEAVEEKLRNGEY